MNDLTILASAASPYNDLQIPAVMSSVMLITRGVGFGLFVLFFVAGASRLQLDALRYAAGGQSEKPHLAKFLMRALLLFLAMAFLYQWTFLKMVSLCDHIAMLVANEDRWMTLIARLTENSSVSIPFLNVTVPTLVGAVALTALQYVEEIFITIRFVVLCLLFCVGPMAWAFSISELGFGALRGWFTNTWQVSFWLVVFSLVKAAIIPLGASALSQGLVEGSVVGIVYSIVILAAIFMIPTLTAAVFSEANMGAVTSAAMSIATYSSVRAAATRGDSVHDGIVGPAKIETIMDAMKTAKADGMSAAFKGIFTPRRADDSNSGSSGSPAAARTR